MARTDERTAADGTGTTAPARAATRWAAAALSAFAVAAAGVAGTGCAASNSVDPVASAAETTQSFPGSRFVVSGEVVSPLTSRPIHFSGAGFLTNHPAATSLRLSFPHLLRRDGRDTPVSFEFRALGRVFYFRVLLGRRVDGRQWIRIDERQTARAAGLESLPSGEELDPGQYLTYLRAVSGGLTPLGSQLIHGVQTTGYRGQVELQKVAARAPADRRAQTVAAVGNLERVTGIGSVPFQVWIDAAHVVRRISVAEGETSSGTEAVKVYMTIDFTHFGEQPRVAAPPRTEVLDSTRAAAAAVRAELQPGGSGANAAQ
jgi:hypothetical protein